jgi:hypothetical protein
MKLKIAMIVIGLVCSLSVQAADLKNDLTNAIEDCISADLAEPGSSGPNVNQLEKSLGLQVQCGSLAAQKLLDVSSRLLPYFDEEYSKTSKATRRVFNSAPRSFFCVFEKGNKNLPVCFLRLSLTPSL